MPPLKWVAADEEGLVRFLVGEKSFNEDRVRKAVQRVNAAKSKSTQGQMQLMSCVTGGTSTTLLAFLEVVLTGPSRIAGRLESFFGAVTTKKSDTGKRKEPEKGKGKAGVPAKKGKSGIGKK